jgi:imidazolonepropionase-like amidohydrolase
MRTVNTHNLFDAPVSILNFHSDAPRMTTGWLEIEGERILRIRDTGESARLFATPGFINAHGHWLMTGGTSLREVVDLVEKNPQKMFSIAMENARKTAQQGITTVCDKGPPGRKNAPEILGWLKVEQQRGEPLPRTFASHWTLSSPGGFADVFLQAVSTKEELNSKLEELRQSGSELVKFILETDADEHGNYRVVVSDDILGAAMEFANRNNMRVSVHAKGFLGVDAAIRHGVAGIEHALQASGAQLAELERKNTFVALTLEGFECRYLHAKQHFEQGRSLLMAEQEWRAAQDLARRLASFHGEGVAAKNVLFASDAGSHSTPHASLRELALMSRMGFSSVEILRAATWNGACFLGRSNVLGKVDAGYYADCIVWIKNPLEFTEHDWESPQEHMAGVMVNGKWVSRIRLSPP